MKKGLKSLGKVRAPSGAFELQADGSSTQTVALRTVAIAKQKIALQQLHFGHISYRLAVASSSFSCVSRAAAAAASLRGEGGTADKKRLTQTCGGRRKTPSPFYARKTTASQTITRRGFFKKP